MKIFVSYTSSDREWAHWIAWHLRAAGHDVAVHEWEVGAGQSIPRWMDERIGAADHLIGVFSDSYCGAIYSQSERWAAYWQDPAGRDGFLVPIEVKKVTKWPPLAAPLKRLSILDLDKAEASRRLLEFLQKPAPPSEEPKFPGSPATQEKRTSAFSERSEDLGVSPPIFPTSPPVLPNVSDPDAAIRRIDDYEPKPLIFGREAEAEIIVSAMLAGSPVIIAGGPGMGKTALATSALYDARIVEHFGRRRVFASLEAAVEPRAILSKLVETLGIPPTGDEATLLRIINANAAERPIAAVLDNVETVFDADRVEAERILNLVASVKGLSLAVTIRGVPPSIAGATAIDDLPKLPLDAACESFIAVAGSTFAHDPDLAAILEALDGHALSIRLVAAQAIGLPSLKGLRETWEEAHAEILRRPGEEEGRLTSVRASLALSLNSRRMKFAPLARRLLTLLAFLPGGLAESGVRGLLGDRGAVSNAKAYDAIGCLHQLRLVERRLDSRLRMLTPLRECVKKDVLPLIDDRERLIDRYFSLLEKATAIGSENWKRFRQEVEEEADNLDAVTEVAIQTSMRRKFLGRALVGLADFHCLSGRGTVASLDHALERLSTQPPSELTAECILRLGWIAHSRSDNETARTRYEMVATICRGISSITGEANGIRGLGDIAYVRFDLAAARAHYDKALALYHRSSDLSGQAACIRAIGEIARLTVNLEVALAKYEEALTLYRRTGGVLGEANCIQGLGNIAQARSDHDVARTRYEEALALYRRIGVVAGEAQCIRGLGGIAHARSQHEAARAYYDEALALSRRVGDVTGEANSIQGLGEIARALSDHETARARYEEGLALNIRIGAALGQANCIRGLAAIPYARFDYALARARYEEALVLYHSIGELTGEAGARVFIGRIKQKEGDPSGLADVNNGFELFFKTADSKDRALDGWRVLHLAFTCNDALEARKYLNDARSAWLAIERYDLIHDWVEME